MSTKVKNNMNTRVNRLCKLMKSMLAHHQMHFCFMKYTWWRLASQRLFSIGNESHSRHKLLLLLIKDFKVG